MPDKLANELFNSAPIDELRDYNLGRLAEISEQIESDALPVLAGVPMYAHPSGMFVSADLDGLPDLYEFDDDAYGAKRLRIYTNMSWLPEYRQRVIHTVGGEHGYFRYSVRNGSEHSHCVYIFSRSLPVGFDENAYSDILLDGNWHGSERERADASASIRGLRRVFEVDYSDRSNQRLIDTGRTMSVGNMSLRTILPGRYHEIPPDVPHSPAVRADLANGSYKTGSAGAVKPRLMGATLTYDSHRITDYGPFVYFDGETPSFVEEPRRYLSVEEKEIVLGLLQQGYRHRRESLAGIEYNVPYEEFVRKRPALKADLDLAWYVAHEAYPHGKDTRIGSVVTSDGQQFTGANTKFFQDDEPFCAEDVALIKMLATSSDLGDRRQLDRIVIYGVTQKRDDLYIPGTNTIQPCRRTCKRIKEVLKKSGQKDVNIVMMNPDREVTSAYLSQLPNAA